MCTHTNSNRDPRANIYIHADANTDPRANMYMHADANRDCRGHNHTHTYAYIHIYTAPTPTPTLTQTVTSSPSPTVMPSPSPTSGCNRQYAQLCSGTDVCCPTDDGSGGMLCTNCLNHLCLPAYAGNGVPVYYPAGGHLQKPADC
ncbi:hypothetical protein ABBQ32_008664 [Trebouxia sp. C0010 RCD-2024]